MGSNPTPSATPSSPAERPRHHFFLLRRQFKLRKLRLRLKRLGNCRQHLMKRRKIALSSAARITSSIRWLRGMREGFDRRISAARSCADCGSRASRACQPLIQSSKAVMSVKRLRKRILSVHTLMRPAQPAEGDGEVHIVVEQQAQANF